MSLELYTYLCITKQNKMKIKNPFKSFIDSYREQQHKAAIEEIDSRIQLREFKGNIFLCYKDVPLLPKEALKADVCEAVEQVRGILRLYYNLKA